MTVSMLSAIKSLDWRLKRIPVVPIEIASLTPTVLNRNPTMPASFTPSFTASERRSRCMLQVLPSYQTEEIPTWGFERSSSERPTPWRIAWEPPWDLGSVMRELYLLSLVWAGNGVCVGGEGDATVEEEGEGEVEEAAAALTVKGLLRCRGWWEGRETGRRGVARGEAREACMVARGWGLLKKRGFVRV